jgi:hypothetical protein
MIRLISSTAYLSIMHDLHLARDRKRRILESANFSRSEIAPTLRMRNCFAAQFGSAVVSMWAADFS